MWLTVFFLGAKVKITRDLALARARLLRNDNYPVSSDISFR